MNIRVSHLSRSDRCKIERLQHAKLSPRHRSTIFREFKRNHFHDSEVPKLSGYWCIVAQSRCDARRTP